MNVYHHASTTVKSRELIVFRARSGWSHEAIASSLGISRRTVCKWLKRWREEGSSGLLNRSSRPMRSPRKLAEACVERVLHLRRGSRMIARNIAHSLGLAPSTVSRLLAARGLGRLAYLDPKPKPVRYERATPGELIHIDIKKIGIIAGVGHRFTGGKRTNKNERKQGTGWEYIHAAVDDHSRLAYVEVLPDETAKSSAGFLIRALRFFRKNGIRVWRVMTDNGGGYRSKLYAKLLKRLTIKHKRTRPYTPKTNGKVERFNQTLKNEWLYARAYTSSFQRKQYLIPFLDFYNNHRQHAGINYKTPASRCEQPHET